MINVTLNQAEADTLHGSEIKLRVDSQRSYSEKIIKDICTLAGEDDDEEEEEPRSSSRLEISAAGILRTVAERIVLYSGGERLSPVRWVTFVDYLFHLLEPRIVCRDCGNAIDEVDFSATVEQSGHSSITFSGFEDDDYENSDTSEVNYTCPECGSEISEEYNTVYVTPEGYLAIEKIRDAMDSPSRSLVIMGEGPGENVTIEFTIRPNEPQEPTLGFSGPRPASREATEIGIPRTTEINIIDELNY